MRTVLLIEDDVALRENTAELLEFENYNVITAANGKLGIKKAEEHIPCIIVCDIMMPEVDGYGVLEAVSINPKTSHIPFIFLSAKTEYKEIRKGMDMGADDYLTKPFDENGLFSAIESRLAKAEILTTNKTENLSENKNKIEVRNLDELKDFFKKNGKLICFDKGATIYKEGNNSNNTFLIDKGIVKSHKILENGKELTTTLHSNGSFLGFNSLQTNTTYQESATAVEHTKLISISKTMLKTILSNNQEVSLELLNVLTHNISEIKEQLLQMAYSSVRKKTAQTILKFARILDKKPDEVITISRFDLASVAGIATESLIRSLSEFKKNGLIEIEGRNIKILQLDKLEAME